MGRVKDAFIDAMEDADEKGDFMFFNKQYNVNEDSSDPGNYGDES